MRALIIEKRVQNLSRLTTCSSYKLISLTYHNNHVDPALVAFGTCGGLILNTTTNRPPLRPACALLRGRVSMYHPSIQGGAPCIDPYTRSREQRPDSRVEAPRLGGFRTFSLPGAPAAAAHADGTVPGPILP